MNRKRSIVIGCAVLAVAVCLILSRSNTSSPAEAPSSQVSLAEPEKQRDDPIATQIAAWTSRRPLESKMTMTDGTTIATHLEKRQFLPGEAIPLLITVTDRNGKDVVDRPDLKIMAFELHPQPGQPTSPIVSPLSPVDGNAGLFRASPGIPKSWNGAMLAVTAEEKDASGEVKVKTLNVSIENHPEGTLADKPDVVRQGNKIRMNIKVLVPANHECELRAELWNRELVDQQVVPVRGGPVANEQTVTVLFDDPTGADLSIRNIALVDNTINQLLDVSATMIAIH